MGEKVEGMSNVTKRMRQGAVLLVVLLVVGYNFVPFRTPESDSLVDRLVYTLRWQLPPLSMLLAGVLITARARHSKGVVDAASIQGQEAVDIHQRYMHNTLEQLALHMGGQLVLTSFLDHSTIRIIPVMGTIFCIGRILFWIGYLNPAHKRSNRALGFVMNHFTNLGMFAFCWFRFLMEIF